MAVHGVAMGTPAGSGMEMGERERLGDGEPECRSPGRLPPQQGSQSFGQLFAQNRTLWQNQGVGALQ